MQLEHNKTPTDGVERNKTHLRQNAEIRLSNNKNSTFNLSLGNSAQLAHVNMTDTEAANNRYESTGNQEKGLR